MSRKNIVLSRPLPPPLVEILERVAKVTLKEELSTEALLDTHIYISTSMDPVPANLIQQLGGQLRPIANMGVGTDNIDLPAAAELDIAVSNTPVVTEDTADLTIALILATCRRLSACEKHLRSGNWATGSQVLGQRVHGKTLITSAESALFL
jgi:glyoxylate reductase